MRRRMMQKRESRRLGERYDLQHDSDLTPLSIFEEEIYLARVTPTSMEERGRRLRAAFPKLWAEHSMPPAALRQVA